MNRTLGNFVHIQAKLGQDNHLRMVSWVRWHCPPDTGFKIQTLEVWGRARYLSVTEAPHNTEFYAWMGKKLQTAENEKQIPNSNVNGSGDKHYPSIGPPPGARHTKNANYFKGDLSPLIWYE